MFLDQSNEDEELNPVLSGYFCKLVSLLISRKQKQLVPYIFSPKSMIIENLVRHVGQKSISEILNKLITQIDSDFQPAIMEQVRIKQQMVVEKLIEHLGPKKHEENNLNASSIFQDMFEIKEFFNIICAKENIQAIADFACAPMDENTKASKTASLAVLNHIIQHHIEQAKKTDKKDFKPENEDEDDMVQQNNDDEENEEDQDAGDSSLANQANVLVEVLLGKISNLENILQAAHDGTSVTNSVHGTPFVPLGQQRLRSVELVLKMIQMKKEALNNRIAESQIPSHIMDLVKQFPWNNFLQLKVINIFTEILENQDNQDFIKAFLASSKVGPAIVEMQAQAMYTMESERQIRHGFMAVVVSISNKLQKKYTAAAEPETAVIEYLDGVGEEWREFVDNELKASNTNNEKTLGGCTTRNNMSEEDEKEDSNYDVQMEKIMARFTNFNQILSQNSGNDDDDDDDDDDTQEDKDDGNFDEDDDKDDSKAPDNFSSNDSDSGVKIQVVKVPEPQELA